MEYIYPIRIVYTDGCVENAESLLTEKRLQIGLMERELTHIKGKASIILDFGKELPGGARILTFHAENAKVRLRFGESVSETCSEISGQGGTGVGSATNDHSLRDMETQLVNYSDMTFGQTGFRFLRIDTLQENANISLKTVVAACTIDRREELGAFECNDPLVNDIWNTAAYTLRLCLQNGYFWDGIKRDRLVWIGDLYPEMRAAECLFGSVPETLNSLDFSMEETVLPNWVDGMPTYSLWWIINLCAEYDIQGKKSLFEKYIPYVKGVLKQIEPYVSEDGQAWYPSNFIDWPTNYDNSKPLVMKEDLLAGISYLTKITLEKAKAFLTAFGEDVSLCDLMLARLAKKTYKVQKYKQIAAVGVWSGDQSENNERVLLDGGANGLSTFMSYPILSAVAAYGKYNEALAMMKEYYGGMLSVGATTFWEDFDLTWLENAGRIDEMPQAGKKDIHGDYGAFCYLGFRHSFCHAWSAGVIPYLMETVVGIKKVGAGTRRIQIKPNLSGLKHVKASYPTPYGIVRVEHSLKANGEVETKVDAPSEIEIIQ